MGKTVPYVFLGLSIAFFLFLVGFTGYRIEKTRRANNDAATAVSEEMLASAKALRDVNGSFESQYFKSKMKDLFTSQPRLLVLTLYTVEDGIQYLIARNKSYVAEPTDVTREWRGKPEYRSSPGFETVITLSYPLMTPMGEKTVIMDSLIVVFGREDLYPILRDDLYLLLSFLIVCGIFILIAANVQEEGKDVRAAASSEGAPALSPRPAAPAPAAASSGVPAPAPTETPAPADNGLEPGAHFAQRLKFEIDRAAAADEDVSVACMEIDGRDSAEPSDAVLKESSTALLEACPLHDLVFKTGGGSYSVIIPDADIDRAVKSLEEVRARVFRSRTGTISVGVGSRAGRLIDGTTLWREAGVSLEKAKREGGNRVVGFRASSVKFRQVLSGSGE